MAKKERIEIEKGEYLESEYFTLNPLRKIPGNFDPSVY